MPASTIRAAARTVAGLAASPAAPVCAGALAYRLFHPPRRRPHRHPSEVGLDVSEHTAISADGRQLHLWVHHGRPDAVVVLGHGIGLGKSASLAHASFLAEAGYTVCLFDHRNHGASERDRAVRSLADRFTDDIVTTTGHVRRQLGYTSARFAVYGFSFSTFPSLYALGRPTHHVHAVVCDSGPGVEVREIIRNFARSGALPSPRAFRSNPARAITETLMARMADLMLGAAWPPPPTGPYDETPMLFLTGTRDRVVPSPSVAALAETYRRAEVCELPKAGHLTGIKDAPNLYRGTVRGFLRGVFG